MRGQYEDHRKALNKILEELYDYRKTLKSKNCPDGDTARASSDGSGSESESEDESRPTGAA